MLMLAYMIKSFILSRSRRQRRPSVHVAFAEAPWRPWTSSGTLASAWGYVCPTSAEVICYLRCIFLAIRYICPTMDRSHILSSVFLRSSPRLLLLASALSCFSLLAIGLALNAALTSTNAPTTSVSLVLKYTLAILTLGVLAIVVRRALAKVQEKGGKRIKTKV